MVNFDSLHLMINSDDSLSYFNNNSFTEQIERDGDWILSNKLVLKNDSKCHGLKNIIYDRLRKEYKIELSAKILRENYYDLINRNTIEQVTEKLNKNLGIKFHTEKFIDNAIVLKCDTTDNLRVSGGIQNYIKHLSLYRINDRYQVSEYKGDSIVFKNNARSFKERIIFYDKMTELQRDKDMLHILADSGRLAEFKNVLRVESNHTAFRKMRELFNVNTFKFKQEYINRNDVKYIQLSDLLNSSEKVNYKIFEKITEKNLPSLFIDYDSAGYTFSEIEKREGMKSIILSLDGDMRLIREFIKSHVSGNITRYVRRYQQLLSEMAHDELQLSERDKIFDTIKEIKEKLVA